MEQSFLAKTIAPGSYWGSPIVWHAGWYFLSAGRRTSPFPTTTDCTDSTEQRQTTKLLHHSTKSRTFSSSPARTSSLCWRFATKWYDWMGGGGVGEGVWSGKFLASIQPSGIRLIRNLYISMCCYALPTAGAWGRTEKVLFHVLPWGWFRILDFGGRK